jgi:hypothetical protein
LQEWVSPLAVHLLYVSIAANDDIQQVSMSTKCLALPDYALTDCGELLPYRPESTFILIQYVFKLSLVVLSFFRSTIGFVKGLFLIIICFSLILLAE